MNLIKILKYDIIIKNFKKTIIFFVMLNERANNETRKEIKDCSKVER